MLGRTRTRTLSTLTLAAVLALTIAAAGPPSVGVVGAAAPASRTAATGVVVVRTVLYDGEAAAGTGVVLAASGEVLTNNHVIRGATAIRVTDPASDHTYRATAVGYSVSKDIAVLKLRGADGLRPAQPGSSRGVAVGDRVVAVGNSGGAGLRTKTGRVTRLGRTITVADDGTVTRLTGLIQTNAPLEPGDSGGPLLRNGRVIGIDAAASRGFSFGEAGNVGFAIPIETALDVAGRIEAGHTSATVHVGPTAFLGVSLDSSPADGRASGALVRAVAPGSPAARAGVGPGSLITAFAGRRVTSSARLRALVLRQAPGRTVTLAWLDELGAGRRAGVRLAAGPPQ